MNPMTRHPLFLVALAFLAGCGQDPPAAPAATGVDATPANPGLALVEDTTVVAQTLANGVAKCNIETLAGKDMDGVTPQVAASPAVAVVGWYADPASKGTGNDLRIVVHDQDQKKHWVVAVPQRTQRPDVDAAMGGTGAFVQSGVSVQLDFSKLRDGYYGLFLEGSGGICGLGRTFEVK